MGYDTPVDPDLGWIKDRLDQHEQLLNEYTAPTAGQIYNRTYANETYAFWLLDVTRTTPVAGVEALVGDALELPSFAKPVIALVTCYASISTRLRGAGGSISVGVDVQDTESGGSSIGINSTFMHSKTGAEDVVLNMPVSTNGLVTFGAGHTPTLRTRLVYSITPGATDGRLQVESTRISVLTLKPAS